MNKRLRGRGQKEREEKKAEAGFTLLETMIALSVFSLALFALWAVGSRLAAGFIKAGHAGSAAARAELVDRGLRSFAARVNPPFWAAPLINPALAQSAIGSESLSLAFLDGSMDSKLEIGFSQGSLSIGAGQNRLSFSGIESARLYPLLNAKGRVAGIRAAYLIDGQAYESQALFSSLSLSGGEAP